MICFALLCLFSLPGAIVATMDIVKRVEAKRSYEKRIDGLVSVYDQVCGERDKLEQTLVLERKHWSAVLENITKQLLDKNNQSSVSK